MHSCYQAKQKSCHVELKFTFDLKWCRETHDHGIIPSTIMGTKFCKSFDFRHETNTLMKPKTACMSYRREWSSSNLHIMIKPKTAHDNINALTLIVSTALVCSKDATEETTSGTFVQSSGSLNTSIDKAEMAALVIWGDGPERYPRIWSFLWRQ